MMPEMLRVSDDARIDAVVALAQEIWRKHYTPIIGEAQVEYMLDKFQSAPSIAAQIAAGYEYFVVIDGDELLGYFAVVPCPEESRAQLSKIYVKREQRRHGVGRAIVSFVEKRCAAAGIRELWLTVNRNNAGPMAFYKRMGFVRSGCLIQDIGSGFAMDDFTMAKPISPHQRSEPSETGERRRIAG